MKNNKFAQFVSLLVCTFVVLGCANMNMFGGRTIQTVNIYTRDTGTEGWLDAETSIADAIKDLLNPETTVPVVVNPPVIPPVIPPVTPPVQPPAPPVLPGPGVPPVPPVSPPSNPVLRATDGAGSLVPQRFTSYTNPDKATFRFEVTGDKLQSPLRFEIAGKSYNAPAASQRVDYPDGSIWKPFGDGGRPAAFLSGTVRKPSKPVDKEKEKEEEVEVTSSPLSWAGSGVLSWPSRWRVTRVVAIEGPRLTTETGYVQFRPTGNSIDMAGLSLPRTLQMHLAGEIEGNVVLVEPVIWNTPHNGWPDVIYTKSNVLGPPWAGRYNSLTLDSAGSKWRVR